MLEVTRRRSAARCILWVLPLLLHAGIAAAQALPLFTEAEQRWINANPVVRYAADARLHPLEYVETGRYRGLVSEYLDAVARKSGLRFEQVAAANWQEAQRALLEGKADLLPNVNAQRSMDEVGAQLRLTDPYFLAPTLIVTRTDASVILNMQDLNGKVVAVRSDGSYARVFAQRYPGVRLLPVGNPKEGLDAVADGEAYAAVDTDAVLLPLMRRGYAGHLSISGTASELMYDARMGVRADLPLLHAIVAKSLGSLTAEETDRMNERWLAQTDFGKPSLLSIIEYRLPQLLMLLAAIALLGWLALRAHVARRAAQRSEEAKSRFLAVMSHEIRTPLNAVIASVEMLQRTPMDAHQQRFARAASTAGEALLSLVNDVLDLSRLEAQRLALAPVPTDVAELAQDAVKVARVHARDKALHIEAEVAHSSGRRLLIDSGRLRQILLNLLSNAVKFTERGRIELSLKVDDLGAQHGMLWMAVKDTGMGIEPSQQATVFDAYSQAGNSTARRSGGTGLGLTICKELVELMGGTITLHSTPGVGTTVEVSLAVRFAEAAPDPMSASLAAGALAVLVVDDHPGNRFVIAEQLRTLGFEAKVVDDGDAALATLGQQTFALVLMDCNMPGMSGYETTRRLRALEGEGRHTPVIAISAATDAAHFDECMESGMDGVLGKPLRLDGLLRMLQLWTGREASPSPPYAPGGIAPVQPLQPVHMETLMAEDLAALRQAFSLGDMALAAHHAHRIKGAASMRNAVAAAEEAGMLESMAGSGAVPDPEHVAHLDRLAHALLDSELL